VVSLLRRRAARQGKQKQKTKNKKEAKNNNKQVHRGRTAEQATRTPAGFEKQVCHNQQPDPNGSADCCAVVGCSRSQ